jgi:hypothetical protein
MGNITVSEVLKLVEQLSAEEQSELIERLRARLAEPPDGDPLAAMDGMFDDDLPNLSEEVNQTLEAFYRDRYGRSD